MVKKVLDHRSKCPKCGKETKLVIYEDSDYPCLACKKVQHRKCLTCGNEFTLIIYDGEIDEEDIKCPLCKGESELRP